MIIYNVTTIIEEDIHNEYIQYMESIHLPNIMATGKFDDCYLLRLTEPVTDGITYCAQYVTGNLKNLTDFRENFLPEIQAAIQGKFGNKLVSFTSVLEKK